MGMSSVTVQQPMQPGGKGVSSAAPAPLNAPQQQPRNVTDLYQQVLGRAPEAEGLNYWNQRFGDTIEPGEIEEFRRGAQPELQSRAISMTSGQPRFGQPNPYSNTIPKWDNATIAPQYSVGGKSGKGGGMQSNYPTARTNWSYSTPTSTSGKSGNSGMATVGRIVWPTFGQGTSNSDGQNIG